MSHRNVAPWHEALLHRQSGGRATNALTIALQLARAGYPVFPCTANKKPAISKVEGGAGYKDATRHVDTIRRMFSWPNAALVGVPTGERSGFDVLDLDYRHGAQAWEQTNRSHLPETRIHQTQNGGRHMLFRHIPGVGCSVSQIATGVDLRGDGGYVIFPPSVGYSVTCSAPLANWPDWLQRRILKPRPEHTDRPAGDALTTITSSRRLEGFRQRILAKVAAAPDGRKHTVLRDNARLLGGIQGQAGFTDTEAVGWLMSALPATVKDWNAARRTALWGLEEGRKHPLGLVDRR